MKTKITQITSGKGPVECCWVVAQVLKYFLQEIKEEGITYAIIQKEAGTENGTLQSATILLKGQKLSAFLSKWLGTIQWIGTSSYRKYHKRKNWFVGIYEIATTVKMTLNESDVKFQAIRSSGAGGQHVNKVSSAVRATHLKTGLQVLASDSRSQHQNKKIALKRLEEKLAEHNDQHLKQQAEHQWKNHYKLVRGMPVRVFEGTDFRVQKTTKSYRSKRQELKKNLRQQKWD